MSSDTTVYTTYPDAHVDERGRYFDGEFLTSQDFVDEQRYHVDRLRRALDHLTVSGVCDGLDVAPAGAWKIKLAPGLAIDRVGRQLLVLAARDAVDVPKDIPGGSVDVGLYYAEVESRIHGGASEQLTGISQINSAIAQLDSITQQNAAMVEQLAASSTGLEARMHTVTSAVRVFRLDGDEAQPAPDAVALRRAARSASARAHPAEDAVAAH